MSVNFTPEQKEYKDYKTFEPFKMFVLQNFPFITEDFDAMTYYQMLCKIVGYLKDTIDNNKLLQENQNEVLNAYNQLQGYVNNYFDNLNVQTEINNKLDSMAESGELQEIITSYLNLKGLLCFNTLNDLKNANNLQNGSFARTMGKNNINDGLAGTYKIRPITSSDVVDNEKIVAVNFSNSLIAEKIKNNLTKKYLLVGDSYGEGYSPDGNVESWCIKFKRILGLTDNECKILVKGGYGFGRINMYFPDLLGTIDDDESITDIIVLGGYNDIDGRYTNISNGIKEFKSICKQKFPNAVLKIGFVGWSNNPNKLFKLSNICMDYINICKSENIIYLNNMEFSLHEYFKSFSRDDFHPNEYGQGRIACNLVNAINTGDANVLLGYTDLGLTLNPIFTSNNIFSEDITTSMKNENILFSIKKPIILNCENVQIACNNTFYDIGDITDGFVVGNTYKTAITPINAIIKNGDNFYNVPGSLLITDKKLKISFYSVNPDNTQFFYMTKVSEIMIQPTSFYIDAKLD